MKFKPGEIAIVIAVADQHKKLGAYDGMECTILKPTVTYEGTVFGYDIDIGIAPPNGKGWDSAESNLRKKKPPFEKGDWNECVWNPYKVKQPEVIHEN